MTGRPRDRRGRTAESPDESRWPATAATLVAVALYITLPAKLTVGPGWIIPALEVLLVIPLTLRVPRREAEEARLVRLASMALIALINVANIGSLVLLVRTILTGTGLGGAELLAAGAQIWLTLIIVFGLWYWELDGGGPAVRGRAGAKIPDFLFPQVASHEIGQPDWQPRFLDYLYVAFTDATAFSPTDSMPLTHRAKALMMAEALCSITTILMVVGRAVSILA